MANETLDLENIVDVIRSAAKRVTSSKLAVGEVLVETSGHLTAEEIAERAQKIVSSLSNSSVYRILEEFEELNIVVHAHLGQQAAVYHLATSIHGHLTCEACGATYEIPAKHFDKLSAELAATYGFSLDRHHVALTGTCKSCQ